MAPGRTGRTIDWTGAAAKFVGMGFPGYLGPVVGLTETVAAGLLLIGWRTRLASAALLGIIGVAIAAVQVPGALAAGSVTAGLERDLLILAGTLVLLRYGPGAAVAPYPVPNSRSPASPSPGRM